MKNCQASGKSMKSAKLIIKLLEFSRKNMKLALNDSTHFHAPLDH